MVENSPKLNKFELLYVIVNFGLGSKVIKIAKQQGITGATVFLGKGTSKNRLLELLDLAEIRKELVIMVSEKTKACSALEALNKEFIFNKPHHGIAFSIPVDNFLGSGSYSYTKFKKSGGVENPMHDAIFVVVDKGKAENVIDAATQAGARGGTIINARGSGIHETNKLFAMEIEPEKEIVLVLCEKKLTESIVSTVREKIQIDEPGNGIIFTQNVNKTYGLR